MSLSAAILNRSAQSILAGALGGAYPVHIGNSGDTNLIGEGYSVFLNSNKLTATKKKTRKVVTQAPTAVVLVKKAIFSSLKHNNDIKWMDKTERMFLRSCKTLFAYKVSQIRAYEALTKVENYLQEYQALNLSLFVDLLNQAKYLRVTDKDKSELGLENVVSGDVPDDNEGLWNKFTGAISNSLAEVAYDDIKEDILEIMKRNAFSTDSQLTRWIVDYSNPDPYSIGPGTGVIELGVFSGIQTSTGIDSNPKEASISLQDPYRIMNITSEDIEVAIEEALTGEVGLISDLIDGFSDEPILNTTSILSAAAELGGLGSFDPTLKVDYIRRQMRQFFLGKSIVGSPDTVHVFIRSNRQIFDFDDAEESSLYNQLYDPELSIDEVILEAERQLYTNKKVDLETYKKLRIYADNSFAMKHVYAGIAKRVSESYSSSNGTWVINVSCVDNMNWLKWSRFMEQPTAGGQALQGFLEEFLTPYDLEVDATGTLVTDGGPQLLYENQMLLRSGLLSYDSGLFSGQNAYESNIYQGQVDQPGSLYGAKIIQHPNGFVYRWKNGIITATANVNTVDSSNPGFISLDAYRQTYGLTATENILNNLDIANIISLLIVGKPYNVETFLEQAYQAHNINKSSSNGTLNPADPLSSVIDLVERQNTYLGNFKPYRMITMSSATVEQTMRDNFTRTDVNNKILQYRERRAEIRRLIVELKKSGTGVDENGILIRSLEAEEEELKKAIRSEIKIVRDSAGVDSSDNLTIEFNFNSTKQTVPLTGDIPYDREVTRAMSIVGAQRRIEDVRLNRDENFFIVSDQYDENTDIRPFLLALKNSNWKIFFGDYIDTYEKCVQASSFMNMEFFCNPEGHLEFRPPQWNRTPLTVLSELFREQEETGRQIVPEFLKSIFETRISSIKREIHEKNVKIAMIALLLGKYPDGNLIPGLSYSAGHGEKSLEFFGLRMTAVGDSSQLELYDEESGWFNNAVSDLVSNNNTISLESGTGDEGDILSGDTETLIGGFDPVVQESANTLEKAFKVVGTESGGETPRIVTATDLNNIRRQMRNNYGIDPASDFKLDEGEFKESNFIYNIKDSGDTYIEIQDLLKKLEVAVSERDRAVSILLNNLNKKEELDEIEGLLSGASTADPEAGDVEVLNDIASVTEGLLNATQTITDIFSGDVTRGSLFDHLIEDDTRNLLGPGSGRRFIIFDEDIINCTFTTQPPDFTRIDVFGDAPLIGSQLNNSFEGSYFWAGATDFDLWREFGYIGKSMTLPFSNNAELQSKPYAILELQLQRVKINKGNVTVVGNEYYRPGDVVYVPEKGLLYYVRSVSHNFAFEGTFTTQLDLEFGHPPGTYLPSPMDVIGMQYSQNPLEGNTLIYKDQGGDDRYNALQPDSTLIFPRNLNDNDVTTLLDYKDNQVRFTNMMIDMSSLLIGNRVLVIRGFVEDENDTNREDVLSRMSTVRSLFENPVQVTQRDNDGFGDDFIGAASEVARTFGASTGSNKDLTQMVLPNGQFVSAVASDKIVEQVSYLRKDAFDVGESPEAGGEIKCFQVKIAGKQNVNGREPSNDDIRDLFAKGGPKQNSWNDLRDDLTNVSYIIEIGILDVPEGLSLAGESGDEFIIDVSV